MSQLSGENDEEWTADVCRAHLDKMITNLSKEFISFDVDERARIGNNLINICKRSTKHLPLSNLETDLFSKMLPKIEATVALIIKQISVAFRKQPFYSDVIRDFLKDLLALLSCVERCFETGFKDKAEIQLDDVLTLPNAALSISYEVFVLYQDCRQCEQFESVCELMTLLFNQTTALTSKFISLWTKVRVLVSLQDHVTVVICVCSALNRICQVFECISGKSPVQLWKILISTLVKYCDGIKDQLNVAEIVQLLCSQVDKRLKDLKSTCQHLKQPLLAEQRDSVLNNVHQCGFNLKVIRNLIDKYQFYLGDCFSSLLDLVLTLYEHSSPSLTAIELPVSLQNDFERNVTFVIEPLISSLLLETQFVHLLKVQPHQHTPFAYCLLYVFVLENIHKLPDDLRNRLLPVCANFHDSSLLHSFFQVFSECFVEINLPVLLPGVMCDGRPHRLVSFYDFCCTRLSSFIVGVSAQHFALLENVLLANVLSDDAWKSMMASDLWTFMGRLESAELCFLHCCYLADLTTDLCCSKRLSLTLRRLFNVLADQHKLLFYRKYPPTQRAEIWICIGFQSLKSVVALRDEWNRLSKQLVNRARAILDEKPDSANNSRDFEELSDCVCLMNDLCDVVSNNSLKCEQLELCVVVWRSMQLSLANSNSSSVQTFVFRLIQWTGALLDVFPSDLLLQVVVLLKRVHCGCTSVVVRCAVFNFLNLFARKAVPPSNDQSDILREVSQLMCACLEERNAIVLPMALEMFVNVCQSTPHETLVAASLAHKPHLQLMVTAFINKTPIACSSKFDMKAALTAETLMKANHDEEDVSGVIKEVSADIEDVSGDIEMLDDCKQDLPADVERALLSMNENVAELNRLNIPLKSIGLFKTKINEIQQKLGELLTDKCC